MFNNQRYQLVLDIVLDQRLPSQFTSAGSYSLMIDTMTVDPVATPIIYNG